MRKKILVAFGTRPEIIKLAPVIRQLDFRPDRFETHTVCTGQHTDLLAPLVKIFQVKIDRALEVMRPGQPLNALFGRILQEFDPVLEETQPAVVMVQGDTTTAAACALAAFHRRIPVAHVEAGLRTADPHNPFPEETNRRLITRLAAYHFSATEHNRAALLAEGVADESISVVGNPVVDALGMIGTQGVRSARLQEILSATAGTRRIAMTTHRRESFGETLCGNLHAIRAFVADHDDVTLVFPVHPNPNVRATVQSILAGQPRVHLVEPLDYPDFIGLLQESSLIVSDSGGIQEEAPTLRKPVLVLRQNTERPEAVTAGYARLAPTPADLARLLAQWDRHGSTTDSGVSLHHAANPFGEGDAGQRIADALAQRLYAPMDSRLPSAPVLIG
jgi:UDP-N-acetylglucosamine 2-epimerase (non-hydrolysing)